MHSPFVAGLLVAVSCVVGCATSAGPDVAAHEEDLIDDIVRMTKRPDGLFDVLCRDGRSEVASAEQLRADNVCNNGGSTLPPFAISVSYACDGRNRLSMRSLSADGSETTETVAFTFSSECSDAAAKLGSTRGEISRPTFIAVCDSRGTLKRFAASPLAGIRRITETPFTFGSECAEAAARTNAAVTPLPGEVARVEYTCTSRAQLEMRVIGMSAQESQAVVPFTFGSECTATAEALRPIRTDIRATVALGICDSRNALKRFSITPAGELTDLGTTSFTFTSDCQRAMADANR